MRKADAMALAAIAAVITIVFSDVLFAGSCFYLRDLTRYYFPTKRLLHDIVRSGDFPLWNPYYSGGQPAAANPEYYVFYPGQWLIFIRDFFLGFRLHIVLHLYIAAFGMYALMRTLGTGVAAAMASAFAFVFGGAVMSVVNLLTFFYPLTWLPYTLLFVWRRRYALAAVFFGIQILAFEPSVLIDTAVLVVAAALWLRDAKALIVIPGGAAIGAVQLVPMFGLLPHTPRSAGLTFDMVAFWSMPPSRLVEVLQPHWFGHSPFVSSDYWGAAAYGAAGGPFLISIYAGLAAVIAIVTGLITRERLVIALLSISCLSWLIAIGDHTPLLRWLYATHLPIPLRFPERFAVLGAVTMVIAGGVMLDRIITDARVRTIAIRVAIVAFAVYAIATLASMHRQEWLLMSGRAAAFALVLLLRERAGAAIVAFTLADLVPIAREAEPVKPRAFFDPPPVVRELAQPPDPYRIFFRPEWSGGPVSARYFADPAKVADVIRNGMFPRLPAAWGFRTIFERDIDQTNLAVTHALEEAMWRVRDRGRRDWLDVFGAMANVQYVAALRPYPNDEPVVFVRLPNANPRYWLADEIVSGGDVVEHLTNEHHSLRAAYVRDPVTFVPGHGTIGRIVERSHDVTIDVVTDAMSFLVAANTNDEHWQARIDGRSVPIVPANIAFQGVVVPPGAHRVTFEYRDRSIWAGLGVTIVALAAAAFIAARAASRPS